MTLISPLQISYSSMQPVSAGKRPAMQPCTIEALQDAMLHHCWLMTSYE